MRAVATGGLTELRNLFVNGIGMAFLFVYI